MALNLDRALEIANRALPETLERYRHHLMTEGSDIYLGDFTPLTLTPDKGYTAKGSVYLSVPDAGNTSHVMTIVAFKAGDGSGNPETYKTKDQLIIPPHMVFGDKPFRVFPRDKREYCMEAAFPLFSVHDEDVYNYAVSLYELGVEKGDEKPRVEVQNRIGLRPVAFNASLGRTLTSRIDPYIQLTTGHRKNGVKFGEHHAIYYPSNTSIRNDALQVVGFLPFWNFKADRESRLCEIVEAKSVIPSV